MKRPVFVPKIATATIALKQITAAYFQIVRCSLFISIFKFHSKLYKI